MATDPRYSHGDHVRALDISRQHFDHAREDRDRRIREAHADGVPAPVIAEAVGLTRGRIYQLLNRKG